MLINKSLQAQREMLRNPSIYCDETNVIVGSENKKKFLMASAFLTKDGEASEEEVYNNSCELIDNEKIDKEVSIAIKDMVESSIKGEPSNIIILSDDGIQNPYLVRVVGKDGKVGFILDAINSNGKGGVLANKKVYGGFFDACDLDVFADKVVENITTNKTFDDNMNSSSKTSHNKDISENEKYDIDAFNKQREMLENPEYYAEKTEVISNGCDWAILFNSINKITNNGKNDLEEVKREFNKLSENTDIDDPSYKALESMVSSFILERPSNVLFVKNGEIHNPYLCYENNDGKVCVNAKQINSNKSGLVAFDSYREGVGEDLDNFANFVMNEKDNCK